MTLVKINTEEIYERTAKKLGVPASEIKKEILFYWIEIDMMFSWCCGYGTYVDQFGHFLLYTKGISPIARGLEKGIMKKLKFVRYLEDKNAPLKIKDTMERVADDITRLVCLDYSIELYKTEVLETYPGKYKITNYKDYRAVIGRLEKLFNLSFTEFPITINHQVQKIFVQQLRAKGLLRHPVYNNLKNRKKKSKSKNPKV